jgi:hypothetical protein
MSNLNYYEKKFIKSASMISGFSAMLDAAKTGYQGFVLPTDRIGDLAKFIEKSDRDLAIGAAKEGLILKNSENIFANMSNREIVKYMKNELNKSPEEIGSIYRKLYNNLKDTRFVGGKLISGGGEVGGLVGKAGERIGYAGQRLRDMLSNTINKFRQTER